KLVGLNSSALGADVTDIKNHLGRHLTLYVKIPLLRVAVLAGIRVVADDAPNTRRTVGKRCVLRQITDYPGIRVGPVPGGLIVDNQRTSIPRPNARGLPQRHAGPSVAFSSQVKDTVPAADGGLHVQLVSEADARREITIVVGSKSTAIGAGEFQGAR